MLKLEDVTGEDITPHVHEILESHSCFMSIVNEELIQEIAYKSH